MKQIKYTLLFFWIPITVYCQTSVTLTDAELQDFKGKALNMVEDLSYYIITIADNNLPLTERSEAKQLAIDLFQSATECQVQVSSTTRGTTNSYPVKRYLDRLQILKYKKVEITWYDIHYVSQLQQAPDGKYYGVVTIYQKFTGFGAEGIPEYSDVTQKNIEMILTPEVINNFGEEERIWTMEICDINVVETKT